jgi:hypothetical protein
MSETTVVEVGADQFRLLPNGLWIDCYDNGIVESTPFAAVLTALAAARREVEAVNEEAERQAGVICNLNTDLATSRAALEDVRRVEAWIQAGNAPDLPEHSIAGLVNARYGAIVRWEDEETTVATGDSLEALGRALAQEAGDAMR